MMGLLSIGGPPPGWVKWFTLGVSVVKVALTFPVQAKGQSDYAYQWKVRLLDRFFLLLCGCVFSSTSCSYLPVSQV
jgi:hypothetical protein